MAISTYTRQLDGAGESRIIVVGSVAFPLWVLTMPVILLWLLWATVGIVIGSLTSAWMLAQVWLGVTMAGIALFLLGSFAFGVWALIRAAMRDIRKVNGGRR